MAKNEQPREMPVWFDGKSINEALFCNDFLSRHKIIYTNGAFFTPDGRVTNDLPLRGEIFEELKCCAVSNIPRKISNIVELMKLAALVEDFPPEQDCIHLSNGTLTLDGSFTEGRPKIVRSRLPVAFRPDAPKPSLWLSFLDGLLYPEDIPTLQEFIGYCLIPSNKGQRMMVMKGSGGRPVRRHRQGKRLRRHILEQTRNCEKVRRRPHLYRGIAVHGFAYLVRRLARLQPEGRKVTQFRKPQKSAVGLRYAAACFYRMTDTFQILLLHEAGAPQSAAGSFYGQDKIREEFL